MPQVRESGSSDQTADALDCPPEFDPAKREGSGFFSAPMMARRLEASATARISRFPPPAHLTSRAADSRGRPVKDSARRPEISNSCIYRPAEFRFARAECPPLVTPSASGPYRTRRTHFPESPRVLEEPFSVLSSSVAKSGFSKRHFPLEMWPWPALSRFKYPIPCLYRLTPFTRPMNINPADRFFPSDSSKGLPFGFIFSRPPSLPGRVLRRSLRARWRHDSARFPPECDQLPKLLGAWECSIVP